MYFPPFLYAYIYNTLLEEKLDGLYASVIRTLHKIRIIGQSALITTIKD